MKKNLYTFLLEILSIIKFFNNYICIYVNVKKLIEIFLTLKYPWFKILSLTKKSSFMPRVPSLNLILNLSPKRIALDCRLSWWETVQTVCTRILRAEWERSESRRGMQQTADARKRRKYKKKRNTKMCGKRERQEKKEKTCRGLIAFGRCERSSWHPSNSPLVNGGETGVRHASREASGASGCNVRERRRRTRISGIAREGWSEGRGERERGRVSDDSRHPKVEAEDGRFAVCASACCLRQNAGGMQCLAAALRYRLHASPNPYVSTRALSVFRLVSLSKLSRSAKCETRRASKRRRDALARNNHGTQIVRHVRKLISIRKILFNDTLNLIFVI